MSDVVKSKPNIDNTSCLLFGGLSPTNIDNTSCLPLGGFSPNIIQTTLLVYSLVVFPHHYKFCPRKLRPVARETVEMLAICRRPSTKVRVTSHRLKTTWVTEWSLPDGAARQRPPGDNVIWGSLHHPPYSNFNI